MFHILQYCNLIDTLILNYTENNCNTETRVFLLHILAVRLSFYYYNVLSVNVFFYITGNHLIHDRRYRHASRRPRAIRNRR